ncbi:hypothetical protein VTI74DRAFT_10135 [Chaetomium olivicolor]
MSRRSPPHFRRKLGVTLIQLKHNVPLRQPRPEAREPILNVLLGKITPRNTPFLRRLRILGERCPVLCPGQLTLTRFLSFRQWRLHEGEIEPKHAENVGGHGEGGQPANGHDGALEEGLGAGPGLGRVVGRLIVVWEDLDVGCHVGMVVPREVGDVLGEVPD